MRWRERRRADVWVEAGTVLYRNGSQTVVDGTRKSDHNRTNAESDNGRPWAQPPPRSRAWLLRPKDARHSPTR